MQNVMTLQGVRNGGPFSYCYPLPAAYYTRLETWRFLVCYDSKIRNTLDIGFQP